MAAMTREEHLRWCKDRALEYLGQSDINQAMTSMMSDLGKHSDTEGHAGIKLGVMMLLGGQLKTVEDARRFIEGFN